MSVQLQPDSTLGFHRPLTQLVKRTLTVSNSNSHAVAFKVKTTAPKQYCVRPNSGRIEAGERVEVQVLLQPMKEDPPSSARCRDKFLVQSVAIEAEHESLALPELWSTVEKEGKGNIHEQKIRCSYLPPVDSEGAEHGNATPVAGAAAPALTNGHSTPPSDSGFSRASSSPAMADASSKINGTASDSPSVGPSQPMSDAVESSDAPAAATSSIPSVAAATVAASAAAGGLVAAGAKAVGVPEHKIKAMVPDSSVSAADQDAAALRSRLQAAEAEVSRLRAQAGTDGLRQRSAKSTTVVGGGASSSGAIAAQKPVGIPLNVVAGLMLAAFVMGVLLF